MTRHHATLLAMATAAAFAASAAAIAQVPQYPTPGERPAMEFMPSFPTSPRDSADRKDVEKDRADSQLAIERDKCGELEESQRPRCIQQALEARDRFDPARRGSGAPVQAANPGGSRGAR